MCVGVCVCVCVGGGSWWIHRIFFLTSERHKPVLNDSRIFILLALSAVWRINTQKIRRIDMKINTAVKENQKINNKNLTTGMKTHNEDYSLDNKLYKISFDSKVLWYSNKAPT